MKTDSPDPQRPPEPWMVALAEALHEEINRHGLTLGEALALIQKHYQPPKRYPLMDAEQFSQWLATKLPQPSAREERLAAANALALSAIGELERSLRAWMRPIGGMGSNIQQEDRGRAAMAFREADRARKALEEKA